MRYEVRYQIGGEDGSVEVEADSAAAAASIAHEQFLDHAEVFELIQVHLLDDMPEAELLQHETK